MYDHLCQSGLLCERWFHTHKGGAVAHVRWFLSS